MKILCIATHPDDETLGAGGTLLRHHFDGDILHWLVVTKAVGPQFSTEDADIQAGQIEIVAKAYGFSSVKTLSFGAAGLDQVSERDLINALALAIREVAPDIVYVNHGGDVHSDHRIVFHCVAAILKPFRFGPLSPKLYAMEIISETDQAPAFNGGAFVPTSFVDISLFIDRKLEIFNFYKSERQAYPLPREDTAIRALARYRGSTIGVAHAEAFMLVREVR